MEQIKKWILERKSVRTFDSVPLTEEDRKSLEDYLSTLENPFHVPVCFRLLEAEEYGLSSPVIVGARTYLAAKVEKVPDHEIAFGYSFEAACLYARSKGIGTVMLAASLSRAAFEKVMEVSENEVLPVASPVGYPAAKRSMRETLMRKGIKADDRQAFEKLFFEKDFSHGIRKEEAGVFGDALEMLRWAPSAANKQPWRAVIDRTRVHFYEAQTMKANALGDVQKVDIGIGLSHFDLTLQEQGMNGRFVHADPGLTAPEQTHYIITYES